MRLVVSILIAIAAGVFAATPKPSSSSLPVSFWYQNNLDWTDDVNHNSFLFVNTPLVHADAAKTCALYGEQLVSASSASKDQDLLSLMRYAALRGDLPPNRPVWLADASAQLSSGRVNITPGLQGPPRPALCTQSARGTTQATSTFSTNLRVNVTSSGSGNTYVGFRDLKSFRFLGIPFADQTARFTYSSVASARNTQVDASKLGPMCFQSGEGSEDCLSLNVFSPYVPGAVMDRTKLRPVLVWIHGGGLLTGTGSDPTWDGGNIASRGDAVVVTINYRLSSLGFLTVPGTNITGNYGLADQVTALQWVKQNIEAFGGDPSKVTIGGQSAGAAAVRALLASPKARSLFHAAIAASIPAGYGYARTFSEYYTPQEAYNAAGADVVKAAGCANSTTITTCLATASAASLTIGMGSSNIIIDGKYIVSPHLDVKTPGNSAQVPVLMGTMADDDAPLLSLPAPGTNKTAALASVLSDHPSLISIVGSSPLFPLPNTGNATLDLFNLTARVGTDVGFSCISQATAHSAVQNGVWPTAYYYQFQRSYQIVTWDPNYPTCDPPRTAAHPNGDPSLPYMRCHSGDLHLWFGTLGQFNLPFRDQYDLPFVQLVQDSFTSFIRSQNPNPDPDFLLARGYANTAKIYAQAGKWAPMTKGADTLRRLDWPPRQSEFPELEQCKLLGLPITYYDDISA